MVKEILERYLDKETGKMNELFVQLFVESNNTVNYSYFMKFHDIQTTFSNINAALKELTGKKTVEYTLSGINEYVFENFKNSMYSFGKHPNARNWLNDINNQWGVVLPRTEVLGWIATQRPERNLNSFLPSDDRNLYAVRED